MDIEEGLDITQRRKRGMAARKNKSKLKRARAMAKRRMAKAENIKKRAGREARRIVRKKFASKKGQNYHKLSPSEKIAVDKIVDKKKVLIARLAKRLIPITRKKETERLSSFMKGTPMTNESLNENFGARFGQFVEACKEEKKDKIKADAEKEGKGAYKTTIIQYNKFSEEAIAESNIYKSILKKAETSGYSIATLGEVYDRGLESWTESKIVSRQQYAFARINSFINGGKALTEDMDLYENAQSDSEAKLQAHLKRSGAVMDKYRGQLMHVTKKQEGSNISNGYVMGLDHKNENNVILRNDHGDHSVPHKHISPKYKDSWVNEETVTEGKSYVKPHFGDSSSPDKQTGWKASNKHGRVKFFGNDFENSAKKHAGLNEEGNSQNNPKKRLIGTDSLIAAFKKDTPGQGVSEAVKSAEKEPVVVPAHDDQYGNTIPAKTVMRKTGKIILNRKDNPYDGK